MASSRVFTAVFVPFEGWWAGRVEEISGVNSQGKTLDEARANLTSALREMLQIIQEEAAEFELREGAVTEQILLEAS